MANPSAFFSRWFSKLHAPALACLLLSACASTDELPQIELEEDGDDDAPESVPCRSGQQRECHRTLAEHNGILSCFDGIETCDDDGRWSACGHGRVSSQPLSEDSLARRQFGSKQLTTLSNAVSCDDNPCDPSCRAFPDIPDAATSDNLLVNTSTYKWETGSLSSYPRGLVEKGLNEPCASGMDCQFNTRCINPVSPDCSHDKCEAGEPLNADCDPCVELICESNPECCTGWAGPCSHGPTEVGAALDEECSECVAEICSTSGFAYCCGAGGGDWDSACVAEVENTCGGTPACCDGEVNLGDSCYFVESDGKNWTQARSSCQARGAGWDLASVGSAEENSFLYNLNSNEHTWIGLTETNASFNIWAWSNDDPAGYWLEWTRSGHPYNNFKSSEPGSSDGCARMERRDSGDWEGRSCSSSYDSFCEGPPLCQSAGGGGPPPPPCEHDPCQTGVALKANCDGCVENICDVEPDCCDADEAWTEECAALVASECTATCECQPGEATYDGHCYYLETNSRTWSSALSSCRARGAAWDLVSITNDSENTFVRSLNGSNDTWLGFTEYSTYGGSNNRWTWTSNDPSGTWRESNGSGGIPYVNWSGSEPDGSGECARMQGSNNGRWADRECSYEFDYVCEASHGSVLSELTPASSTANAGGSFVSSNGPSFSDPLEELGEWTNECAERVQTTCSAQCDAPDEDGQGLCVPWYPGQTDETCAGADLAVGVPCDGKIPVCNHGTEEAPAGVRLVHFPASSQQYPSCEPNTAHPQMRECFTSEPIPPGECVNVTSCPSLSGNREIMVNPTGAGHVEECSCLDNWGLYSGGECGPPVCSGGTNVATLEKRPIDIIISIDNSASMQGEIVEVQNRINQDFAQIIQDSGVDYRVIMVSRYGNVHVSNFDSGGVYDSAFSICVGQPLSDLSCPGSAYSSTPRVAHKEPRFYHHSTDIGSHDLWCKLLNSYDRSDPYPTARSGFNPIAPDGWGVYLRPNSFKIIVAITDDNPTTNSQGSSGECASSTGFTDNLSGARAFDRQLRELSPDHFGPYSSTTPDEGRNYAFYSIVGMAGNHSSSPTPLEPSAPVETRCCRGNGSSTTCPNNNNAPLSDGVNAGRGYQELSKITGGLRYPSCYTDNFDQVFNAIAAEVIEGAQLSCTFELQNEGSFDIETATVWFEEEVGDTPIELQQAPNLAGCSANGWYLPDPANPAAVALCPSACSAAQNNEDSRLSVEVGCLGAGYDPYTFSEVYSAECRFDQRPQWGFFSPETTTPGDATVVFRVRTAATEAELEDADYVELATLSTASGNAICSSPDVEGCPLDLYEVLGGAPSAHHEFIEVEVTVNPTSNGSQLPSIESWGLSYSCPDAQ